MSTIWLIAQKELRQSLHGMLAYLLALIFVISLPLPLLWLDLRTNIFLNGQVDLNAFFGVLPVYFLVFIPALAMRAWSEERGRGTIEMLLTLPISESQLVLGKFLGFFVLLLSCILLTLPIPFLIAQMGDLDWGPVIGGYIGVAFMAAASLAIAMFAGSFTRAPVQAFILALLLLALASFVQIPELSLHQRFANIARGLIDTKDLAYYVITTLLFLHLNILVFKGRR